jgi:hypothetical protein
MLEGCRQWTATRLVPREIRMDGIREGLEFFRAAAPADAGEQVICRSPVFILSAGWRSGSTLLQRLVCADSRTLIWGEPYGDRVPVCRLASMLSGFHPVDPHWNYTIGKFSGDLSQQWVANLNPGVAPLRQAHLSFLEQMFAAPARDSGADRWGAKWVRLTAAHAQYLQWLYPDAKLLFLVRHPLAAYLSYKNKRWYTVRPHHRVNGVAGFMAHWKYLAESFIADPTRMGGFLVRYEDLVDRSSTVLTALEEYLGAPLRREALDARVGQRDKGRLRLSLYDRGVCAALGGRTLRRLGYSAWGETRNCGACESTAGAPPAVIRAESAC